MDSSAEYANRQTLPKIDPPILNSACPWATTSEDIEKLLDCPYTGAVTTRTCMLEGFRHDPAIHQFVFFNPQSNRASALKNKSFDSSGCETGSLNTFGYSPVPLKDYLHLIQTLGSRAENEAVNDGLKRQLRRPKPIIVSVTGSPEEVCQAWRLIACTTERYSGRLCMEINLSCPNIPNKPPPAYHASALLEYLETLNQALAEYTSRDATRERCAPTVPIGIKCPPYTYLAQFENLIMALVKSCETNHELSCPISFITATNTLGSSLLMDSVDDVHHQYATLGSASGEGIGGLGGTAIHPLSLGNVRTLRRLLDEHPELCTIDIIGVGGVKDAAGVARMKAVGAKAVALATALGREGIQVFEKICNPP